MKSTFAFVGFLLVLCAAAPKLEAQDNQNIPPRVEIGGIMSAGTASDISNSYEVGGGGRVTINVTKYLAGEAEATRQPTDYGYNSPIDMHTFLAAKVTCRAEQRRWLKFAGINFFGVIGPAFINRNVILSTGAFGTAVQPQTASTLEYGGGFELVPARHVAVRFDVTHANFSQPDFGSQPRTYFKAAVMLRFP